MKYSQKHPIKDFFGILTYKFITDLMNFSKKVCKNLIILEKQSFTKETFSLCEKHFACFRSFRGL